MKQIKENRILSLIIILIAYACAFVAGYFVWINLTMDSLLLKFLITDVVATIVIFIFSLICRNASVYDPYWSVLPLVMVIVFAKTISNFHPASFVMIALIAIWGIRLTINWFSTFKNLNHQDWRYDHYKNKFPRLWPIINFGGIHLMPTLIVFSTMLPVVEYMNVCATVPMNVSTIIGIVITIVAIIIETLADLHMHSFLKTRKNHELINVGLWKRSRHPNYFGEILFWFGIYLVMLSLADNMWILFLGPLLNTLLFVFISIPLAEKHQLAKNPAYLEYQKTTNVLLLFPKKTINK